MTLSLHIPFRNFPKASLKKGLSLKWPLSVSLLNSYSSFKSQLPVHLLCEIMAHLPLSPHRPLFPLAAACLRPAPKNLSRVPKLSELPGLFSEPESDPLLSLKTLGNTRRGFQQAQASARGPSGSARHCLEVPATMDSRHALRLRRLQSPQARVASRSGSLTSDVHVPQSSHLPPNGSPERSGVGGA